MKAPCIWLYRPGESHIYFKILIRLTIINWLRLEKTNLIIVPQPSNSLPAIKHL